MMFRPVLAIGFVLAAGAVPGCVCSKSDEQPAPRPPAMQNPTHAGAVRPRLQGAVRDLRLAPIRAVQVIDADAAPATAE